MKTAIYIEDGVIQLVITPESDFEKDAMKTFEEKELNCKIHTGSFYDCRGGWVRQKDYHPINALNDFNNDDKSMIVTLREEVEVKDE